MSDTSRAVGENSPELIEALKERGQRCGDDGNSAGVARRARIHRCPASASLSQDCPTQVTGRKRKIDP